MKNRVNHNLDFYTNCFIYSIYLSLCLIFYGWMIFLPVCCDALMHTADDLVIKNFVDVLRNIFGIRNDYGEVHTIGVFHRPIFNELYITLLKFLFPNQPVYLRASSLLLFFINVCIFHKVTSYFINEKLIIIFFSLFYLFSIPHFYGLFEFGLSFSILLNLFFLISLFFLIKSLVPNHNQTYQYLYLFISCFSAFLLVFTKESAVLAPFSILLISIYFVLRNQGNIEGFYKSCINTILKNKFIKFYFLTSILIIFLYLLSRYFKLGDIFYIAAGLETNLSFNAISKKIYTYLAELSYFPTKHIGNYMLFTLKTLPEYEVYIRTLFLLFFIFLFYIFIKFEKSKSLLFFLSMLLIFIPIFKVYRNSPYYSDILSIPFYLLSAISFSIFFNKNKSKIRNILIIISLFFLSIISYNFQNKHTNDPANWIASGHAAARGLLIDFEKVYNKHNNSTFLISSGILNGVNVWWYNQNERIRGSLFNAHFGIPLDRFPHKINRNLNNFVILDIDRELNDPMHNNKLLRMHNLEYKHFQHFKLNPLNYDKNHNYFINANSDSAFLIKSDISFDDDFEIQFSKKNKIYKYQFTNNSFIYKTEAHKYFLIYEKDVSFIRILPNSNDKFNFSIQSLDEIRIIN